MSLGKNVARALLAICTVVASLSSPRVCRADGADADKALATSLFREAKALLDAGEVATACRKLEESWRLEPAGGTLLNLAVCHEREGKSATAWTDFQHARAIAERDGRVDRVAFADVRLTALEPTLSKIVIVVVEGSANSNDPSLTIVLDDRTVGRPAWGTSIPLDPGKHVIEARASNKRATRIEIDLQPNADSRRVVVPELEVEVQVEVEVAARATARTEASPNRTIPLLIGAIGIGGLAVGSIFGVRAFNQHEASTDACVTNPCSMASEALNDSAKTSADISTTAFTVGLVALGVSAWLWFSARPPSSSRNANANANANGMPRRIQY